MTDWTTSTRTKIKRAQDHLEYLKSEFEQFNDSKPYEIHQELNAETGEKSLVYYPTLKVPLEWSVVLGELLYDLRSALDHIVYGLSTGVKKCEFPIFDTPERFFAADKRGRPTQISGLYKIRGIASEKARKVIEQLQPFNVRKPGSESFAWVLQGLCNIDKHRMLNLCRRQAQATRIDFVRDVELPGDFRMEYPIPAGTFEERTVLFRYTPLVLNNEVEVEASLALYIAFDEGQVPTVVGKPVEAVCQGLIGCVERIVALVGESLGGAAHSGPLGDPAGTE